MIDYIVACVSAFVISFFFAPVAKKLAVKTGAIDVPKDNRRMHSKPIAKMGGLSIIVGFLVSIIYVFLIQSPKMFTLWMRDPQNSSLELIGIFIGMIIIIAMGILDDKKPLTSKLKFAIQILVAVIVVSTGTRIQFFTIPFKGAAYIEIGEIISIVLSILWIVGITNAINLIDGLDGLAAGVSGIAAFSLCFVSAMVGQPGLSIIYIALAGSIMGFLPYNFNPAKIFMGDTGALFLGYVLAVLSIEGATKSYTVVTMVIPLVVLGLPIFDTAFALIRRVLTKKPIGQADRGHIHHRLIDRGISHKYTVTILYVVSGALGLLSIVLANDKFLPAIILVMIIAVFFVGGERYIAEMLNDRTTLKKGEDDTDIENNLIEDKDLIK